MITAVYIGGWLDGKTYKLEDYKTPSNDYFEFFLPDDIRHYLFLKGINLKKFLIFVSVHSPLNIPKFNKELKEKKWYADYDLDCYTYSTQPIKFTIKDMATFMPSIGASPKSNPLWFNVQSQLNESENDES